MKRDLTPMRDATHMTADKIESEGKKMQIKVFVNFSDQEVRSEKEFNEMRAQMIEEEFESTRTFNAWLDENYSCAELFELEPPEKKSIREDFHAYLESYVDEQLIENALWEEFIIEA